MSKLWGREPALILALVQAVLAMVAAFGLHLSGEQVASILAVTAAVLGVATRQAVTPNGSVVAKVDDPPPATVAGPAADVPEGDPVHIIPGTTLDVPQSSDAKSDAAYYTGRHAKQTDQGEW